MDRKVGVGVVGGRMGRRIGKFSQDVGELSGVEEEEGRDGGGEVRRGSFSLVFLFFSSALLLRFCSVVIKVGMVGDSQIGKTSLMVKYVSRLERRRRGRGKERKELTESHLCSCFSLGPGPHLGGRVFRVSCSFCYLRAGDFPVVKIKREGEENAS